ncbi:MAG: AraC family transcriptional regulator [Bacteroidota bacterium]
MKIAIKNMVCQRCVRVVKEELEKAGFHTLSVSLGEAELKEENADPAKLAKVLADNGFELLEEKSARLINDIKHFVTNLIRSGKLEDGHLKFSKLLEEEFHKEYGYISQLFTQSESSTLEKYIIAQKVERVKEWLAYDELTLSEMANRLGYSSVAYLSSQFKQVTGFTPSEFKKLKHHSRKGIDEV